MTTNKQNTLQKLSKTYIIMILSAGIVGYTVGLFLIILGIALIITELLTKSSTSLGIKIMMLGIGLLSATGIGSTAIKDKMLNHMLKL